MTSIIPKSTSMAVPQLQAMTINTSVQSQQTTSSGSSESVPFKGAIISEEESLALQAKIPSQDAFLLEQIAVLQQKMEKEAAGKAKIYSEALNTVSLGMPQRPKVIKTAKDKEQQAKYLNYLSAQKIVTFFKSEKVKLNNKLNNLQDLIHKTYHDDSSLIPARLKIELLSCKIPLDAYAAVEQPKPPVE